VALRNENYLSPLREREHGAVWCLKTFVVGAGLTTTRWNQSVNAYTIALHQRRRRAVELLKETKAQFRTVLKLVFTCPKKALTNCNYELACLHLRPA